MKEKWYMPGEPHSKPNFADFLHLEEPHPNYSERMYSMRHGAYYSNGYCHNLFLSP